MIEDDGWNPGLEADCEYLAADLTLWRDGIRGCRIAVPPPISMTPNPMVSDGRVMASLFSPGQIRTLQATTGKRLWRKRLGYYGGAPLSTAEGLLFVGDSQTLFALNPDTAYEGEKLQWSVSFPKCVGGWIRYDAATDLLYEATSYGLGIVAPGRGRRLAWVHGFERGSDQFALPATGDGILYVLSMRGTLRALRMPPQLSAFQEGASRVPSETDLAKALTTGSKTPASSLP